MKIGKPIAAVKNQAATFCCDSPCRNCQTATTDRSESMIGCTKKVTTDLSLGTSTMKRLEEKNAGDEDRASEKRVSRSESKIGCTKKVTGSVRTPISWWKDQDVLLLCGIRSILSGGVAAVMVASEHYLFTKIMKRDSGKTQRVVSLISTLSTVQAMFVNGLAGYSIDRFGRKPVLVAGCFLSAFARSLPVLRPTVRSYIVYRLLNSFSFTAVTTSLVAFLSDRLGGRASEVYQDCLQKRFLMMAIVRMITLRIAGRSKNLKYNFIAGSILPALAGILFALFVRERQGERMGTLREAIDRGDAAEKQRKVKVNATRPTKQGFGASYNPLNFVTFFGRTETLQAVAALLVIQYVPMYNQTESVRRRKKYRWGLRDSEALLQISNACEVISPWLYPYVARLYGLDRIRDVEGSGKDLALHPRDSPLLRCSKWDFRIGCILHLSAALSPTKYILFLHPLVSLFRISSVPERTLDIVLRCDRDAENIGEGEKIAALGNLPIPLGLVLPTLFAILYQRGNRMCLFLCAALQLFGSEVASPWAWRRFSLSKAHGA